MSERGSPQDRRRPGRGPSARQWLAGAVTALFSLGALSHALSNPEADAGAVEPPPPERGAPYIEEPAPAPARDAAVPAELARRLDAWERDARDWRAKQQTARAAERAERERLDGLLRRQEPRLAALERRLQELARGQAQLLALARAGAEAAAGDGVPFVFRGTEVWNGQIYALLEHEGRILSARQGEERLGWRVRAIDRERRSLRISDGRAEHTLEER